jgi:hypothetical protein
MVEMDEKFHERMLAAITGGSERCTVGLSTAAGTRFPNNNYKRPD